jgi:hypothetical protein
MADELADFEAEFAEPEENRAETGQLLISAMRLATECAVSTVIAAQTSSGWRGPARPRLLRVRRQRHRDLGLLTAAIA